MSEILPPPGHEGVYPHVMTVAQLKEKLKEMPDDAFVCTMGEGSEILPADTVALIGTPDSGELAWGQWVLPAGPWVRIT